MKNRSSNFALQSVQNLPNGVSGYRAQGALPNMYSDGPEGTAHSAGSRNMIEIAAGVDRYTELHQTQCEVLFTPALLGGAVNVTERSISVVT